MAYRLSHVLGLRLLAQLSRQRFDRLVIVIRTESSTIADPDSVKLGLPDNQAFNLAVALESYMTVPPTGDTHVPVSENKISSDEMHFFNLLG